MENEQSRIKICFVLNADPDKTFGGTPAVVKNIRKYIPSDIFFGRGSGISSFLYPLITGIKLLFKKYDIINIHDTQGYGYILLPKFMRRRTIYSCHGLWELYFAIDPPNTFLGKIKANMARRMQIKIIKRVDHITAVSQYIKNKIIEKYGIDVSKITVIHNGVDTKKFYNMNKKRNKKLALWVGRDPIRKGLKEAITYAKKKRMKLMVIGLKGKNNSTVEYLLDISNEKLVELYNKASKLLFFTKSEAHPLVPLEAMACGLDVIASKESNIEIMPKQKDGSYIINGKKGQKND